LKFLEIKFQLFYLLLIILFQFYKIVPPFILFIPPFILFISLFVLLLSNNLFYVLSYTEYFKIIFFGLKYIQKTIDEIVSVNKK
jgi:hypothetical protein